MNIEWVQFDKRQMCGMLLLFFSLAFSHPPTLPPSHPSQRRPKVNSEFLPLLALSPPGEEDDRFWEEQEARCYFWSDYGMCLDWDTFHRRTKGNTGQKMYLDWTQELCKIMASSNRQLKLKWVQWLKKMFACFQQRKWKVAFHVIALTPNKHDPLYVSQWLC